MERIILHADLNNFYASVECVRNPSLWNHPIAVCGDPEARHGIVLAKNQLAKVCKVKTGDTLWQAKQKCPDILFVAPHFELYDQYSKAAREIYGQFTDQVEPFGLDECWLDVTDSKDLFGSGKIIANTLRDRIRAELGITISVGVSFNKIFAKLGSDLKKPDATTVISPNNFRAVVWPLPANDLLYVGRATYAKLLQYGIHTIGDIAGCEPSFLVYLFGKNGQMLWEFANGLDAAPVASAGTLPPMKTIGNGTTTPRDLVSDEDVRLVLMALCEKVSARLREANVVCRTVAVQIRDNQLMTYERQGPLEFPNRTAQSLLEKAFSLYRQNRPPCPVRSIAVRAVNLETEPQEQISFLPEITALQRQESLETAVDSIRHKFGKGSIRKGLILTEESLVEFNPQNEYVFTRG